MNQEDTRNKMEKVAVWLLFSAPAVMLLVMWLFKGWPVESVYSKSIYYVQIVMTMLVVVSVPFLLWYVRPERYVNGGEDGYGRYRSVCLMRLMYSAVLSYACVVLFFVVPNVAFLYLALMAYLMMPFALSKGKANSSI